MEKVHERVELTPELIKELDLAIDKDDEEFVPLSNASIGMASIAPEAKGSTHPRLSMLLGAYGSSMPLSNPEVELVMTGFGVPLAAASSRITMPENGVITKIIRKNKNVCHIHFRNDNNELGSVVVTNFVTTFERYGFALEFTERFNTLMVGNFVVAGEVFAESVQVARGVETNTVNLYAVAGFFNQNSEDSLWVSQSGAKKLETYTFPKFTETVEQSDLLINAYGDINNYKPLPEVGDFIRPDKLILAKRSMSNVSLAPALMDAQSLLEFNENFDRPTYGPAGGEVIDIEIVEPKGIAPNAFPKTMEQLNRLLKDSRAFNDSILTSYKKGMECSDTYTKEAIKAFKKNNIKKLKFKYEKITSIKITITIKKIEPVVVRSKGSGKYGNKGIICKISPDHMMPTLADGTRAELVYEVASPHNRNNSPVTTIGGLGMQLRQLRGIMREAFGCNKHEVLDDYMLVESSHTIVEELFEKLKRFYKLFGSPTYINCLKIDNDYQSKVDVIYECVSDEVRITMQGNETSTLIGLNALDLDPEFTLKRQKMTCAMDEEFITFKDDASFTVQSFMLLNKLADKPKACHIPHENMYELPTGLSPANRNTRQGNTSPVVLSGGTETRTLTIYTEQEGFAHNFDLAKNPESRAYAYGTILRADNPSDIDNLVDRNLIPYGQDPFTKLYQSVTQSVGYLQVYKHGGYFENDKLKQEVIDQKWSFKYELF